jgi:hypothetical protein
VSDVGVTVDIGDTFDMLDTLAGRVGDVAPLSEAIRTAFLAIEKRRFDEEGPGWADLAPSTLAAKAAKGYPSAILRATLKLMDSLTDATAEGSVFLPEFADDITSFVLGTSYKSPTQSGKWADTALGAFHQYGADHGTYTMPARPIVDADDGLALDAGGILAEWLSLGTVAAGI